MFILYLTNTVPNLARSEDGLVWVILANLHMTIWYWRHGFWRYFSHTRMEWARMASSRAASIIAATDYDGLCRLPADYKTTTVSCNNTGKRAFCALAAGFIYQKEIIKTCVSSLQMYQQSVDDSKKMLYISENKNCISLHFTLVNKQAQDNLWHSSLQYIQILSSHICMLC